MSHMPSHYYGAIILAVVGLFMAGILLQASIKEFRDGDSSWVVFVAALVAASTVIITGILWILNL